MEPKSTGLRDIVVSEILEAGQPSHPERLRGKALAVIDGTITDQELIEWFIAERAVSSATTRANYVSQLQRLQCFVLEHLGWPSVRNVQREDWAELVRYLKDPPSNHLPGPRGSSMSFRTQDTSQDCSNTDARGLRPVGRANVEWRPFKVRLKPASIAAALSVIGGFYAWLSKDGVGAVGVNPFGGLKYKRPAVGRTAEARGVAHYLEREHWSYVLRAIEAMPVATRQAQCERARARWVFTLLVQTGLRASEIAAARSAMIQTSSDGGWHLAIIRKGNVASKTYLPASTIAAWDRYRTACAIAGGAPGSRDDLPLVGQLRAGRMDVPVTRQSIWNIITRTCTLAASIARDAGDIQAAARLDECSPHWLRHTFGTWLIDSGTDLRSASSLLEHASIATTTLYLHTDIQTQRADLERMTSTVSS